MARIFTDNNGYPRFSDSGILVHQWVARKELGYIPGSGKVIHHKDRNKQNNSPDNLAVFSSQKIHDKIHKQDAKKHGWKYSFIGKKSNTRGRKNINYKNPNGT
jgi:hypothetical protein